MQCMKSYSYILKPLVHAPIKYQKDKKYILCHLTMAGLLTQDWLSALSILETADWLNGMVRKEKPMEWLFCEQNSLDELSWQVQNLVLPFAVVTY